ncbi:MAG: Holliday junction resolvase RuvX [Weeksellaceae bacterium]|nr:Holliday junction resolvase RuvX [Weeksellaceae bacterium]
MDLKGSVLAVDYGKRRTGLAITDPMRMIASPLDTVPTEQLMPQLHRLQQEYQFREIVVGLPMREHGVPGELEEDIQEFLKKFQAEFPNMPVHRIDESYTSIRASEAMWQSGAKKKKRQEKGAIDRVSAAIILQQFLES